MKSILGGALVVLLVGAAVVHAEAGQGRGKKHAKQASAREHDSRSDAHPSVHVVFGSGDIRILRDHYAPRYRNLPPGLQKKVARGRALPPGWQKRFETFPVVVERQLPPLPRGYRRGVVDGHAVIYNSRTNVVVDLAVLF